MWEAKEWVGQDDVIISGLGEWVHGGVFCKQRLLWIKQFERTDQRWWVWFWCVLQVAGHAHLELRGSRELAQYIQGLSRYTSMRTGKGVRSPGNTFRFRGTLDGHHHLRDHYRIILKSVESAVWVQIIVLPVTRSSYVFSVFQLSSSITRGWQIFESYGGCEP